MTELQSGFVSNAPEEVTHVIEGEVPVGKIEGLGWNLDQVDLEHAARLSHSKAGDVAVPDEFVGNEIFTGERCCPCCGVISGTTCHQHIHVAEVGLVTIRRDHRRPGGKAGADCFGQLAILGSGKPGGRYRECIAAHRKSFSRSVRFDFQMSNLLA